MNLSLFIFKFIDYGFDYLQNYSKYHNISKIKDIIYNEAESDICKLDLYYKPQEGKYPVFIYIHGGGFVAGDKKHRRSISSYIAEQGFMVVNINYGLCPDSPMPDFILHCVQALDWIYNNAIKYNLDLDNVFVGGDSAGGYLSAVLGAINSNKRLQDRLNVSLKVSIKGLVMISGSYDMVALLSSRVPLKIAAEMGESITGIKKKSIYRKPEAFDNYPYRDVLNPIEYINSTFPISFVAHSTKDFFVPKQGEIFVEHLKQNNVKVFEHKANRLIDIHCYPIFRFNKQSKACLKDLAEFLNSNK